MMKRMVGLIALMTVIAAVTLAADDVKDWYLAKKVAISVNAADVESKGFIWDSKPVVPVKELANELHAIVKVDPETQKIKIFNPNVHMLLVNKALEPFAKVDKGTKADIQVLLQVDTLETAIHSFKFTIVDPSGKETELHRDEVSEKRDNFWYKTPVFEQEFKSSGKYMVNFYMRINSDDPFTLVSQKAIFAN